jgi:tetratricopeptide (TPR) repeat protein
VPKRPSQHQLENESLDALRSALPKAWVFRELTPDYGIDATVEVFTAAGASTGDHFHVQLKATAQTSLRRALIIRVPAETAAYYRSLMLPLLIALYHAPTKRLYVGWFRSLDLPAAKDRKTVTLRLEQNSEWEIGTPNKLASDLAAVRLISAPEAKPPFIFRIASSAAQIGGIPHGRIFAEVLERARTLGDAIVHDQEHATSTGILVKIESSKAVVSIGTLIRVAVRTPEVLRDSEVLSKFAHDVLIAIGLAMARANQVDTAARVFATCAGHSTVLTDPGILVEVVETMRKAHRLTEALQLSEELFNTSALSLTASFLFSAVLARIGQMSPHELKELRAFFERQLERAKTSGKDQKIAAAHYSLGNHFRRSNNRLALAHYRAAARFDPGYLKRRYFWRDLGGVFFEHHRFQWAVRCYEEALRLGEKGLCEALYADALMFAGRYAGAKSAFEGSRAATHIGESEWRLKRWALAHILKKVGRTQQKRETKEALKLAGVESPAPALPLETREPEKLEAALGLDALCGLAWFNLGVSESFRGDKNAAFADFLTAALIQKWDVEAWCNAMTLATYAPDGAPLIRDIVRVAHRVNGKRFLDQVDTWARSQSKGFPVADFVNLVYSEVSTIPKEEESVAIRLLAGDSIISVQTNSP